MTKVEYIRRNTNSMNQAVMNAEQLSAESLEHLAQKAREAGISEQAYIQALRAKQFKNN